MWEKEKHKHYEETDGEIRRNSELRKRKYEQRKEEEVGRISVKSEMKGKNFLSVQFDDDLDTITKRMFAEERFYRGEQITRDKKLV